MAMNLRKDKQMNTMAVCRKGERNECMKKKWMDGWKDKQMNK